MKTKFTLKNENGKTLKYAFKGNFIFNGDNPNARSEIIYSVAKQGTAEFLLNEAISQGFKNIEILEFEVQEKEKRQKENSKKFNEICEPEEIEENSSVDPEYLFKKLNEKCLICKNECKQPSVSSILKCPQFEKK